MHSSTAQYDSADIDGAGKVIMGELKMKLMSNDTVETAMDFEKFVSDETAYYFKIVVYIFITGCVSIIGIGTNTINIIVFVRQGIFTDGGSPSLLGLAVADLFCVITMLWTCVSFSLVFVDLPALSWNPWDIVYITGAWPHLVFAQTTRMVTAYLALERCVCVVFPFRVKSIFTPRRTVTVIAGIFVCCGMTYSPVFITQRLKWIMDPNTNTSRLILVLSPSWHVAVRSTYFINTIGLNLVSVALVFLCTMITASRVKLSRAWRESLATGSSDSSKPEVPRVPTTATHTTSTSGNLIATPDNKNISKHKEGKAKTSQNNNMSKSKMQKEKKLVRMILLISITSLVCFSPDLISLILNTINSEIQITGRYTNLSYVMYAFTFLMETINSSINIIIYYKMSSRYKQEFLLLFGRNNK